MNIRVQFSLRTLFRAIFAVCVLCALMAFVWHLQENLRDLSFGGDHSGERLTYEQFVSRFEARSFDPRGARQISYHVHTTRDGYDEWHTLSIAPDAYESLLEQFSDTMEHRDFASHDGEVARALEKTETSEADFPTGWPQPEIAPPKWWSPPLGVANLRCARWDIQIDDSPFSNRAMGWYWLYDSSTQALWTWEWNYQHCPLRRLPSAE